MKRSLALQSGLVEPSFPGGRDPDLERDWKNRAERGCSGQPLCRMREESLTWPAPSRHSSSGNKTRVS